MATVLQHTRKVQEAIEYLQKIMPLAYMTNENDRAEIYITRFYVWGKTHTGVVVTKVGGVDVEWLKEGVTIELLDNGVAIYQETKRGTAGEIVLRNHMATQGNIETAIKMALEGIN